MMKRNLILACVLAGLTVVTTAVVLAQSVPDPVLKITLVSTNQLQIQITNAVSAANYEIYRTPVLGDPAYPWTLHLIGSVGQSNFTANMGIDIIGFFQAGVGSDWDSDGVPNWLDAQPSNPGVGALTITIVSPTHGSTVD